MIIEYFGILTSTSCSKFVIYKYEFLFGTKGVESELSILIAHLRPTQYTGKSLANYDYFDIYIIKLKAR